MILKHFPQGEQFTFTDCPQNVFRKLDAGIYSDRFNKFYHENSIDYTREVIPYVGLGSIQENCTTEMQK